MSMEEGAEEEGTQAKWERKMTLTLTIKYMYVICILSYIVKFV